MIKKVEILDDKNIVFKVSAEMKLDGERDLISEIRKAVDENNKINIIFIVENHINEVIKKSLDEIKWIFNHSHINKTCIVAESDFLEWLISVDIFFDRFIDKENQYFEDLDIALNWIKK